MATAPVLYVGVVAFRCNRLIWSTPPQKCTLVSLTDVELDLFYINIWRKMEVQLASGEIHFTGQASTKPVAHAKVSVQISRETSVVMVTELVIENMKNMTKRFAAATSMFSIHKLISD